MLQFKYYISLLFVAGIVSVSSALIVWDGKIVTEWPDESRPFLSKTRSSSDASKGFGFYSRPSGKIYCLTMIVDFSDETAKFTNEQVDKWLNEPGYSEGVCNGSVRDYYYDCSNGMLELTNDVYGYYRAKKPRSYYENFPDYTGADELVSEMIDYFDAQIDFSKYDNDDDGTTEAISFVYAGEGLTWGRGLWPHAGYIGKSRDNVRLGRYNMSDMGRQLVLYVFCHETGHMLFGWPDLYWFGDYCIMGNRMSDVNPQAINDFFRADQGWIPVTDITPDDNKICTATHNGAAFRYVNPNDKQEMFLWSVIRTEGRWSNVSGNGILLYHFNARIHGNTSGTQRTLYIVEADGDNRLADDQWPSPGYDAGDFFNGENADEFSQNTWPESQWGFRMYDIGTAGDTMSFKVGNGVGSIRQPVAMPHAFYRSVKNSMLTIDLLGRAAYGTTSIKLQVSVAPGCYVTGENMKVYFCR
jgi:M6 family metalloprotease-like protein